MLSTYCTSISIVIVTSIVSVFSVFRRTVGRIWKFFILKLSVSQGESSLKFQLIRVHRFGGVREQIITQNHWHPIALEDRFFIFSCCITYVHCKIFFHCFFSALLLSILNVTFVDVLYLMIGMFYWF